MSSEYAKYVAAQRDPGGSSIGLGSDSNLLHQISSLSVQFRGN